MSLLSGKDQGGHLGVAFEVVLMGRPYVTYLGESSSRRFAEPGVVKEMETG